MRFRFIVWITVAAVVATLLVEVNASRAGVVEEEIAELRREVAEIKKEVGEIKNLLQGALKPQSPPKVTASCLDLTIPYIGIRTGPKSCDLVVTSNTTTLTRTVTAFVFPEFDPACRPFAIR